MKVVVAMEGVGPFMALLERAMPEVFVIGTRPLKPGPVGEPRYLVMVRSDEFPSTWNGAVVTAIVESFGQHGEVLLWEPIYEPDA